MKVLYKADNPLDAEYTLSISMPLREWIKLDEQLGKAWPSSRLASAINTVVMDAKKNFVVRGKGKDAFAPKR